MAETNDAVRACIMANHANTRALLACLRACERAGEGRPYREVEDEAASEVALTPSMQTPHTLLCLLERAGAVERIEVPEAAASDVAQPDVADDPTVSAATDADAVSAALGASADPAAPAQEGAARPVACDLDAPASPTSAVTHESVDPDAPAFPIACDSVDLANPADPADPAAPGAPSSPDAQPVDYLLRITEAGRQALAEFDPVARFAELLATEPQGYLDAYVAVLDACAGADGASLRQVEQALAGHPALTMPKRIYPAYFVSKLETVEGIAWDGAWRTTAAGERMLASLT